MKNPNMFICAIVTMFLQFSFSSNAQSGKVDFKAEQPVSSIVNYSPAGGNVRIVKAKTLVKFNFTKGERVPDFEIKKQYEFKSIGENKSTTKLTKTEFKPFMKTNKYQFNETKTEL